MICFNNDDVILFVVIVGLTFVLSIICICVAKCRRTNTKRAQSSVTTERSHLYSPLGVRPTQSPPLPPITSRTDTRQSFNYILPVIK
jgi:hypothetical protein